MNSKFSSILKVRKQAVDVAEARLAKARNNLRQAIELKNKARNAVCELSLPTSGNSADLLSKFNLVGLAREQLALAIEKVDIATKELSHFEHLYKRAYMEYEKINYLHEREVKNMLKLAEKAESVLLDEFGVLTFNKNKKSITL